MAANLALLIGPSYASDLPDYCGPLKGVQNDLELMTGMLCRNGFLLENIKVCCEEILNKLNRQEDNNLNDSDPCIRPQEEVPSCKLLILYIFVGITI